VSWNVLITARTIPEVGPSALELLRQAGCTPILPAKMGPLPAADLLPLLDGADAALVSPDDFSAPVLQSPQAARLKIISRWGVGYDSIDVPAATQLGIVVAYTPGLLDEAVADLTWALLLGVARRVAEAHHLMRHGAWTPVWGHDVAGKTLGILGCGRIGQAVARRAAGFRMRVIAHDVAPSPAARELGVTFVSLDELFGESDFLTLHAAFTPESRGLVNEARLRQMKPSAYLVNTARGGLIDEAALVRALTEGWIAGAALDVFSTEPLPTDHPFRRTPNLVLTPHQASFARETGQRVSLTAAQAIVDLKHGRRPRLVLNPEVFAGASLRASVR
jgi:phosphoglycerate dehydrogenase-like enzyme